MASEITPPGDPTEVLGRRAFALLIDAALLAVIGFVVFAWMRDKAFTDVRVDACLQLKNAGNDSLCLKFGSRVFLWPRSALSVSLLFVIFAAFLDGVVLQSFKGSTVGKMCVRLCVVDERGMPAHPLRMFGRWAMLVIDLGFFLLGCIVVGTTHPHRRLGDFVFGTYVVSLSRVGRPISEWMEGGLGRGGAGVAAPGVGEPAIWTAPPMPAPAPALASPPTPARPTAAVVPVPTPPGTAPTAPGEWGAVARPAPLVRSPQWEAPPEESEVTIAPIVVTSKSTQWAAPPTMPPSDGAAEDATEAESEPEIEIEAEAEAEAEVEAVVELEAEVAADDESESEPEPELELEAELGDDDAPPSQWKPVESAKGRNNVGADENDESWWDAALSSGDSEDES